jgi:hypothetical protein
MNFDSNAVHMVALKLMGGTNPNGTRTNAALDARDDHKV